jgi:transposase
LWQAIQSLLPTPPRRYGGCPRVDDRAALAGIVYQLRTGIPWRLLPTRQLGCGSPVTCWRRLRACSRARRADRLLAGYARSALRLLAEDTAGHLRVCPAPSCGMFYRPRRSTSGGAHRNAARGPRRMPLPPAASGAVLDASGADGTRTWRSGASAAVPASLAR